MSRICSIFVVAFIGLLPPFTGAAPVEWAGLPAERAERVVFVAGELAEENLIALGANLAASKHPGVLLIDTLDHGPYSKAFLASFGPERVVPVGGFSDGVADLKKRLGVPVGPVLEWKDGMPAPLANGLFPTARQVVICPAEPRRQLVQSAYFAGILQAPLIVLRGQSEERSTLKRQLASWRTEEIHVVGAARSVCHHLPHLRHFHLMNEEAVASASLRRLTASGPVDTLLIANPADCRKGFGSMSCLAPWLAVRRRAALLLTDEDGTNVAALAAQALKHSRLRAADNLILLADLRAIPMERRPNPLAGKDAVIEMEPLTPTSNEPFSFATGRLFHRDPGVVTLMLARQRLLQRPTPNAQRPTRNALVVSNPGGGLPLLEMFSRNTVQELRNRGYKTIARFGKNVTKEETRKLLAEQDIFLWEGHHSTLIKEFGFAEWREPLPPSLVFLQSCLALAEEKVQPVLQRGAVAVAGTSTRTYSASGGAFSLAFFNAMLYEDRPLGGSMRQAKNFLLAYSLLKEKRLGKDAKLAGANLRTAWAFTLWGDPMLKLPAPKAPETSAVRPVVLGNTIVVELPETAYRGIQSEGYHSQMRPNARLAGLLKRGPNAGKHLVPFIFAEVRLPKAKAGRTPHLKSRLPSKRWVFCWDDRRRVGYLLVTPRSSDQHQLRFHVEWTE